MARDVFVVGDVWMLFVFVFFSFSFLFFFSFFFSFLCDEGGVRVWIWVRALLERVWLTSGREHLQLRLRLGFTCSLG